MRIERHPLHELHQHRKCKQNSTVYGWQESEYVPAIVNADASPATFLFPVKLILCPKKREWLSKHEVIAVRVDVYPFWWVYVWLHLQLEYLSYRFRRKFNLPLE